MILTTLTANQTMIWINNLNKVIDLRNAVKKYSNAKLEEHAEKYYASYSSFYRSFHGVSSFEDLYLSWDGYYHIPAKMFGDKIKKLGVMPPNLLNYKLKLRYKYSNTRDTVLSRLKQKWEKYACQPFQIQEADLEMYQNLFAWHAELKEILVEGGVYDEAFNLDEDR